MSGPAGEEAELTSAAPAEQLMAPIEERRQQDMSNTWLAKCLKTEQECLAAKVLLLQHEEAVSAEYDEVLALRLQVSDGENDVARLVLAGELQERMVENLQGEREELESGAATLLADAESRCQELFDAKEVAMHRASLEGVLALGQREAAEERRVNAKMRHQELAVSKKLRKREEDAEASIAQDKQDAAKEIAQQLRDVHLRAESATKLYQSAEIQSRQVAEQRLVQEQWYQSHRVAWESEQNSEAAYEGRVSRYLQWQREESEAMKAQADYVQHRLAVASEEAASAKWDMQLAWEAREEAWTTEQQSRMAEHRAQQDLLASARFNSAGPQSWAADTWGYGPWAPPWGPSVPPCPWACQPRRRLRGGQMEREGKTGHLKPQGKGHGKGCASEPNEAGGPSAASGGE